MADVRLLIREEGRAARNLVAFNVPVGSNNTERVTRKPPSIPRVVSSVNLKRNIKSSTRVRSASTGRDKKSELHARYWAFLFGNLQRAVDGIYQTCEEDENISECKEVILVLENYTRDFHNLIEWFKVKWAYENSPPPLRQTSLAWEVRKTSPCRMWNSSRASKCSSPLQRISPVCWSPEDQIIDENKPNESEKNIHVAGNNYDNKGMKENKNNVTKKDPKNIQDKRRNSVDKESEKSISREKSVLTRGSGRTSVRSTAPNKLSNNMTSRKLFNEIISRETKHVGTNKENKNIQTSNLKRVHSVADIERVKNKTNGTLMELSRVEENSRVRIVDSKHIHKNVSKSAPSTARTKTTANSSRNSYSSVSKTPNSNQLPEPPKMIRSKTTLSVREVSNLGKARPGSSVMVGRRRQHSKNDTKLEESSDISGSVEVLSKQTKNRKPSEDSEGWQTVRGRCRRGSSHSLSMSTRFHRPTTATSLPALAIESSGEKKKKSLTSQSNTAYENCDKNEENTKAIEIEDKKNISQNKEKNYSNDSKEILVPNVCETNSTSMIAAIFKSEAELLEKKIQQFMTAQAERERIILEEEMKTEEADSKRSQQLSDEEADLQKQIEELESTEIDVDTETDETDGEMILEIEEEETIENEQPNESLDNMSLEDRYENMLEGMSWAERVDTLAQLQALVARHPGRALELHQKLSSPSRKRSLPETLRRYQTRQACAQHKRQKLLSEKSQRLRELLNKVEDVKRAKDQLTEDRRIRMEMRLKRAEENRTQHLLEVVRKAHDEDSKLKEIAFINELEAQNKRHDFMALCQEQEERLQGIQEERQRRQEEKAAKEAAAEERRRALEAERQLRIQKMKQTRREREERVGKMQLEREKERQELAREKARDREERLSALHAAQLANQEELQKKIAQKQQESARRHGENIEHIRQRAVELSILKMEEIPPTLKAYPAQKQCTLCNTMILNEVCLLSHLKGKQHLEAVKKMHDGKELSRDDLQKFNIAQIKDIQVSGSAGGNDRALKEKQKALKRRSRKLKQRMTVKGQEWENSQTDNGQTFESSNKTKFRRNLKELDRLCSAHAKTIWSSVAIAGLERCLGEIGRIFNKSSSVDQDVFRSLNGFETLTSLLHLGINIQNNSHSLPNKSMISICRVYKAAVNDHPTNIEVVLLSNKVLAILDLISQRFEAVASLDDQAQSQESTSSVSNASFAAAAIQLLCSLIPEVPSDKSTIQIRIHDITGVLVTGGLIDRITRHNRALIEADYLLDQDHESPLLLASYDLLHRLTCHQRRLHSHENSNPISHSESEQTNAESHLLGCLESTEAAGAVSCLYATFALAHQKCSSPTPGQNSCNSSSTKLVAIRALKLLKSIGEVDLATLQKLLGAEGTSLQWRLIASHLITRFLREPLTEINEAASAVTQGSPSAVQILNELFSVIGYFAVNNNDNQLVLQTAGAGPSVLQHLCTLPFPFYGDPRLAPFTLPTLLAATHNNPEAIAILSCEMSYQLLEEYRNSEEGKLHPLIRLMKDSQTS